MSSALLADTFESSILRMILAEVVLSWEFLDLFLSSSYFFR